MGEERKGSCGRDRERVLFAKNRGELGGRNGRRNSIRRDGIRGRIADKQLRTAHQRKRSGTFVA